MSDLNDRQVTIDEWKKDFKGYINALNLPKDDYNGIMEYIDELPSAHPEPCATGYIGIEDDYPVSVKQVLNITAETGALVTQMRVRELPRYAQPVDKDINVPDNDPISRQGVLRLLNAVPSEVFATKERSMLSTGQTYPRFCENCGADMTGDDEVGNDNDED